MRKIIFTFSLFFILYSDIYAATHESIASGAWSADAATVWDSGTDPVNGDTVNINSPHTVTYDKDMTGWADGVTLTIDNGATLIVKDDAGDYYLMCQADLTLNGTLQAGTSTSVPFTGTFTIDFNSTANSIECGGTGVIKFYCTEPTNKWIQLSALEATGQTELSVDTDVTGDIWADSDYVRIDNINNGKDTQECIINAGGIAAGAITVTAGTALDSDCLEGAYVILVSRNIKISNSTSSAIRYAVSSYIACEIRSCTHGIDHTDISIFGGSISGAGNALSTCNNNIVNSVLTGNTRGSVSGTSNVFNGLISGNTGGLQEGRNNSLLSIISGCNDGMYRESSPIVNSSIIYCTDCFDECISITMCGSLDGVKCLNSVLSGKFYNTLFDGITEFDGYNDIPLLNYNYIDSFNHDQVENAYKAWCRGGIVTSQTASPPTGYTIWYEHACESADYPCFRQYQTTVLPGTALEVIGKIRIADGEDLSANPPALQIIDFFADPLIDDTKEPLDEDEIPEPDGGVESDWQDVSVIWANQGDSPRTVLVRMIAYHATACVDEVWAIALYQEQIQRIYNKLPTNYIMGSSDIDNHDTDIDTIKEKIKRLGPTGQS